ncbi:hypothetical protein LGK95_18485 [Clostridium algoriphilum]|uniref:hypothetical protein n=1 Tax=Clostridium algoriphilum TaxID=198347 RepID=UPI001CF0E1C4|nr:hypothetical protein [Clostridium algoriphilum]MCB2295473.1 hypothetical protein [Clostridium algoriphilum]
MKYISLKTKLLTGLLTGGIYLSSVGTAFAATTKPLNINGKAPLTNECKQINTKIQKQLVTNIEDSVTANTITKDQANKIKAVINKDKVTKKTTSTVAKTTTGQESKTYLNKNKVRHINPLTALINNGTITETQAEKILMKQIYLHHIKMAKSLV